MPARSPTARRSTTGITSDYGMPYADMIVALNVDMTVFCRLVTSQAGFEPAAYGLEGFRK